jgi:hypothetical protein
MQMDLILTPDRLPKKPYCTDALGSLKIRQLERALTHKYIQVNPPHLYFWLALDIDREGGGLAWEDPMLPCPNFSTVNRENGHAHLLWGLSAPVLTTEAAREAPLRYLNAIKTAYTELSGADRGYAGLITKNPLHEHWRVYKGHNHLFDLNELAEAVPDLNKFIKLHGNVEQVGIGRNVSLFDTTRLWAYTSVRLYRGAGRKHFTVWHDEVLEYVLKRNGDFKDPLQYNEARAIAKSIAKWVWNQDPHAQAKFSKAQAFRGAGGLKGQEWRKELEEYLK